MNDNLIKVTPINNAGTRYKIESTEDYLKNGFRQVVYVLGAPADQACFKLDIYCNFECLPASPFLNYLPLSMSTESISNIEKKNAISIVQQKPIMNIKDNMALTTKPSIWEKLKQKFKNSLPGIGKLIGWGLTSMIPGLKPGLALAGTMLNAVNEQEPQRIEEEVE